MKTVLMVCMALVLAMGAMPAAADDYNGDGTTSAFSGETPDSGQ